MQRHHTTGAVLFSVLLLFTGLFTINDKLYGNAAATAFVPSETATEAVEEVTGEQHFIQEILENPKKVTPLPAEKVDTETLWLARVIYSETKRPEEMELVAWVIRNRVETGYRGKRNYQSTVLDPFQFSAFNPGRKRTHYSSLTPQSNAAGFDNAIRIAFGVKNADPSYRPFSQTTRHFYSEQSMVGVKHPNWAKGGTLVKPQRNFNLDERRFRFFANVA